MRFTCGLLASSVVTILLAVGANFGHDGRMDLSSWTWMLLPLLAYVIGIAIALLLLYAVIRVGVARGLRDHQLWMERNRPQGPNFDPNGTRRF
ncbi:hypothetical protein D7I47_10550 [Protaetiibacter intestinalis]|uniref:Uncharacterized protein n=1 Tax=Protaetiibacter intestinalis TaxID=2419774 RepID=A0A387B4Y8_9MICO|nr:hypothetical protein D7I47_10550 [Protaetiibacter intestinalis]